MCIRDSPGNHRESETAVLKDLRVILNNGRKPIYIWSEQVVGTAIYRDLGALEDRLERSVSRLDIDRCLQLWKTEDPELPNCAIELCNQAIQGISARWKATMDPILDMYWSLNVLCHTRFSISFPEEAQAQEGQGKQNFGSDSKFD